MFTKNIYSHQNGPSNIIPVYLKIENILEITEDKLQKELKSQDMFDSDQVIRELEYSDEFYNLNEEEFEEHYINDINFRIKVHDSILGEDHSDARKYNILTNI